MIINKDIYFIHIPRTGGRFLRETFKTNNCNLQNTNFNFLYRGKEAPHLTYPEYHQYLNYLPIKKFCVVRDPFDRFLSMIKSTWIFNEQKIEQIFQNQSYFNETLNNFCLNDQSNFFVPQINFIDYDTKIWKFENGFNLDFIKWIKENFNLELNTLAEKTNYINPNLNELYLNDRQINYVKNFYYKDYKLLDY
tara:strand:+ start:183 stop:761 length:579 start_codon:yes stop_codon:yes gene_type:complete